MPRWLTDEFTDYLSRHPLPAGQASPLFPGRHRHLECLVARPLNWDEPWYRDPFYKLQFRPARKLAGLPANVRIRGLRHTHASLGTAAGISLYRVSRRLVHSGIGITDQLYTHLFATNDAAEMDLLLRRECTTPRGPITLGPVHMS